MKALSLWLSLALGLGLGAVACAVPAEEPVGQEEEATETQSTALISRQPGGGLGWSAKCKACKDQCDIDFPVGDTTNTKCKERCVLAGTCTKTSGPGVVMY